MKVLPGCDHEDCSVSSWEVASNTFLSTRVESWTYGVSENIRIVSNTDLVVCQSVLTAVISVVNIELTNMDGLAEISLPPRVGLKVCVGHRVWCPRPKTLIIFESIDSVCRNSLRIEGKGTLSSSNRVDSVRKTSEGLHFTKGEHFIISWNGDSNISACQCAVNGLATCEQSWARWIGKDTGRIVSNVNLIVGKSVSTAILSVLDDDLLNGLYRSHINLPPGVAFIVSATEGIWHIYSTGSIVPHACSFSINGIRSLSVATGSICWALSGNTSSKDIDWAWYDWISLGNFNLHGRLQCKGSSDTAKYNCGLKHIFNNRNYITIISKSGIYIRVIRIK